MLRKQQINCAVSHVTIIKMALDNLQIIAIRRNVKAADDNIVKWKMTHDCLRRCKSEKSRPFVYIDPFNNVLNCLTKQSQVALGSKMIKIVMPITIMITIHLKQGNLHNDNLYLVRCSSRLTCCYFNLHNYKHLPTINRKVLMLVKLALINISVNVILKIEVIIVCNQV